MRSIEALPEPVRSSVRSGIIVYDLARVVEELVFNSLDAGATKVSVYIGVGTCYIKVVDNGCGVSRDGLVLLGERYATSKFKQPTVPDTARGSFGFRGEALCSISDISLLEIISKAHGRPNGYRKVMKGSKCLYLEIDNDRQDVGTTVVARDLFYNQPVRRKHMQSSSKKVLHSVKKCVLRIALMHSEVCFKVLDVESEDELLCANPSKSLLLLLKSGFGIDISTLQKLNVSDRMLSLTGYISGPFDAFYVKAFQYIYINSRFICKGPIHKLLNQLAVDINCSEPLKDDAVSQNRKRSRFQTNPSYILNIICPRDCYDLTFEPSKTTVEFKDWNPVLSFIEHAVTRVWSVNECHGDSFGHALDSSGKKNDQNKSNDILSASEDCKTVKKRFRSQNHQISLDLLSSCSVSHMENCDYVWSDGASCQNHHGNALEFKECESNMGVVFQSACSYEPYGGSFVQGRVRENPGSDDHLFKPEPVIFCSEDMLGNEIFAIEKSEKYMDNSMSSTWEDMHLESGAKMNSGLLSDAMFLNCTAMNDDVKEVEDNIRKPVLKCCFFRQSLIPDGEIFTNDDEFTFQADSFTPRQKQLNQSIRTNKREFGNRNLGIEPKTLWKDEAATVWSSPRPKSSSGIDSLSRYSMRSPSTGGYTTEDNLPPDMGAKSNRSCSNDFSKWTALTTNPCFGTKIQDKEHFIDSYLPERHSKYDRSSRYLFFAEDHFFSFDTIKDGSNQEYCMSSRRQEGYTGSEEDFFKFQGHNLDDIPFPNCTDFSDKGWLYLDSCGINKTNFAALLQQNSSSKFSDENKNSRLQRVTQERENKCEKVLQRSHSAPPFYRGKRKFFALNTCSIVEDGKSNIQSIHTASTWTGTGNLTHHDLSSNLGFKQDSLFDSRPDMYETSDIVDFQNFQMQDEYLHIKDLSSKETQDPMHEGLKWRNSCPQTLGKSGEHSHNLQDPILDISSGILHLAGDSLVTKFINKKFLENAKVLPQVDRKFIPVVANGILAIVDQHAADERIRLEELRQKVLSGEMKTTKYLDAEQELVLPEIGYQLLHNYAEQIQSWGWICNIHLQGSRSFKKNLNLLHRQPTVATLLAVPCILGVNLTDMDLLEFLQQLADTDGSSTMPPSVLRVLNSKACRGAIMFGDSLLPSECSLIVEELKKTSLCFQCAHGRPTTVPLVNLEILHAQLAKLGLCGDGSPNELWHGLCRHEVTLERAMNRVSIAGDQG